MFIKKACSDFCNNHYKSVFLHQSQGIKLLQTLCGKFGNFQTIKIQHTENKDIKRIGSSPVHSA